MRTIMRSPEVLEQVCMPDFGSQMASTSELKPVLAEADDRPLQSVERRAAAGGSSPSSASGSAIEHAAPGAAGAAVAGRAGPAAGDPVLRAVAAPTLDEAAIFGRWLHDENFGSDGVETIVARPTAKALSYLDPRALVDIPMTELYWPFGLAALHDEHLADATAAAVSGKVPWEALSSKLETGDFEIFADYGWGFRDRHRVSLEQRRNRRGLSFARGTLQGEFIRRVRLDRNPACCASTGSACAATCTMRPTR